MTLAESRRSRECKVMQTELSRVLKDLLRSFYAHVDTLHTSYDVSSKVKYGHLGASPDGGLSSFSLSAMRPSYGFESGGQK